MRTPKRILCCCAVVVSASITVFAQAPVTTADVTRLEEAAANVEQVATGLAKTDPTLAAAVVRSLDELKEEIAYLKVKLRREGHVTSQEYAALRDRIEALSARAQGRSSAAPPVAPGGAGRTFKVPVGTELQVRLQTPLNSGKAKLEERFEATLLLDYSMQNTVVVPAGAIARGFVSSLRAAGGVDPRGSLTLSFDELRIEALTVRLRATVVGALDPKAGEDLTGMRAGVGANASSGSGALIGVLVVGGGTMASTGGTDVDLPLGTVLRIRLNQPVELTVR